MQETPTFPKIKSKATSIYCISKIPYFIQWSFAGLCEGDSQDAGSMEMLQNTELTSFYFNNVCALIKKELHKMLINNLFSKFRQFPT